MRKYGKLLLVLSVLAVCPATASADGFLGGRLKPSLPFTNRGEKERNQELAEQVAGALKEAQLNGYGVEIEVRGGVAILDGNVRDATHRALATRVASSVQGIERVENNLRFVPPAGGQVTQASATSESREDSRVFQAAAFEDSAAPQRHVQQVSNQIPAGMSNQQVAEQIAGALGQAGLVGYEIEVRFNNGVASLGGNVATVQQRQAASSVVSQIPGVRSVENRLQVNPTVQQTNFAPQMAYGPQGGFAPQQGYGPQGMQPGMGMPQGYMSQASMSAAQQYAPSPVGAAPVSFTNPNLPGHAWPAYAQYPNSAAVTYPTQYSASAWPYIGPFYPYPQVPLGWREVSLEWDDGYWQLNFNEKKKEWFWLTNPKNW